MKLNRLPPNQWNFSEPDRQDKRGLRQTLRSGFNRAKGLIAGRPLNTPPVSGHEDSENLTAPSLESQTPSLPRPSVSVLAPSVAWSRLDSSLRTLESRLEKFPPLRSAVSAFIGCLDTIQAAASDRADYENLADDFQSMVNSLIPYARELKWEAINGSIADIIQGIERNVEYIEALQNRGTSRRLLEATRDQDNVIECYRRIENLFRQLHGDLSLQAGRDAKKELEASIRFPAARLRRISPVDDARYNSSYSTTIKRHGCTAKTREAIHENLQIWATNPVSENIYWMNGMAGTGKTTIAYSFCEWLEATNRLGASFFCSRISSTCRSLSLIVPTIAYQLAQYSTPFRSALSVVLEDNPDADKLNVVQQFEKLVYRPTLHVKNAIPDFVVIVIDALDECDDTYSVRLLLDVLLKFADQLPLKFFVSSRPEPVIRDRMMSKGGASRSILYLHDIEQSIVEADIRLYLIESLSSMMPPPLATQIELLAKRSRNLFIYAATVVRYVCPEDAYVDSNARLESILATINDPKAIAENKYEDLDRMYDTVLEAAFSKRLDSTERQRMQTVLWTVVCAREPITSTTIASLASVDERQVWAALQLLRSVVHVPEDYTLMSTLHASFPEYMLDRSRSKRFYCDDSTANQTLTHRCFDILRSGLIFNICKLENSYLRDDQVEDLEARIARYVSPTLSYACQNWGTHLSLAPEADNTQPMLLDFLSDQLLFWMEVLSLKQRIGIGAPMLHQVQTWLRMKNAQNEIQRKAADARNFVTWYAANPCSSSTPHIYISALAFCAKSNWVYQHYQKRTQGLANVVINHQDDDLLAVWSATTYVSSVAVSPGGDLIAAGIADGDIYVYDFHTGTIMVDPLKGHASYINSVTFSPDGMLIASGSDDATVIVWGTHTGNIAPGPLLKHTRAVQSIAFSPDGKRIVSGSYDSTVIIWDIYSGDIVIGPLEGHSSPVYSVAFSPDARLIASGSMDQTIRLWDAASGAIVAGPLVGHTDSVNGVAFSPDGNRVASCSNDKTIRMWDVYAGSTVGNPFEGHQGGITALAFSPDGTQIVSGGDYNDRNIIVWDVGTGLTHASAIHRHIDWVRSVLFLPDGSRIISCSYDQTIRIWRAQTEEHDYVQDHGQTKKIQAFAGPLAFSPDRSHFVSNSPNGLLVVSELLTGAIVLNAPEKNPDPKYIDCLALSSQGLYLATSTNNFTIQVWNVRTGSMISQPLKGHNDSVRCLSFSPDGKHLCSGSDDSTLIIWDVEAGCMSGQPYYGHTGHIRSVAYSPDGIIASGAADYTVRVWDSATGALAYSLDGHKDSVESVALSHDGRYIVSGSRDGSIRKWELSVPNEPIVLKQSQESIICIGLSPDSTQIITGYQSIIYIFDAQTASIISELYVVGYERICWVGFSPDYNGIISVSKSQKTRSCDSPIEDLSKDYNTIRIWRAGPQVDLESSSSDTSYWSPKPDGRILSPEGFVIWVPPDFLQHLSLWSKSYFNPFVLSAVGIIDIGYKGLCIGDRWAECYIHEV